MAEGATPETNASATEDPDAQDQTDAAQDGEDDGEGASTDQDEDQGDAAKLGDAGKKALDAMKAKYKAERDKRRAAEAKLTEAGKKDETGKDGKEPDAERVRRDAEQAALSKANARILRAEVKAAAAGKLADPADALRFLDLDSFDVGDDGEIDTDELADAIADLLKDKPYLAAAQGGTRFKGTADGGARNGNRQSQITREELARMSPEERLKAHKEGRLKTLLGG